MQPAACTPQTFSSAHPQVVPHGFGEKTLLIFVGGVRSIVAVRYVFNTEVAVFWKEVSGEGPVVPPPFWKGWPNGSASVTLRVGDPGLRPLPRHRKSPRLNDVPSFAWSHPGKVRAPNVRSLHERFACFTTTRCAARARRRLVRVAAHDCRRCGHKSVTGMGSDLSRL